MKKLTLATLSFTLSACVATFDTHHFESNQTRITETEPVSFNVKIVSSYKLDSSWKEKYSGIVRKVLERHHVPIKQVASLDEAERQHLEITVLVNRHEYSAQDMLTGLSLYVIPSWTTREKSLEYVIEVYEGKRLKGTSKVDVDERIYMGIIFIPFSWITFFTEPEKTDSFERAIEATFHTLQS